MTDSEIPKPGFGSAAGRNRNDYQAIMYWRLEHEEVLFQHSMSVLDDLTPNMLVPEQFPIPQSEPVVKYLKLMLKLPDMEEYHAHVKGIADEELRRNFFHTFFTLTAMRKILQDMQPDVYRMLESVDARHDLEIMSVLSQMIVGMSTMSEWPTKLRDAGQATLDEIKQTPITDLETLWARLAVEASSIFATDDLAVTYFSRDDVPMSLKHFLLRETTDHNFLVVVGAQWS